MHQIQYLLGLRPKPRCGSLRCTPGTPAGFKGPLRRKGDMMRMGKDREGEDG